MVKAFFVFRKSVRETLGQSRDCVDDLFRYIDDLREDLSSPQARIETLELVDQVKALLVRESLTRCN